MFDLTRIPYPKLQLYTTFKQMVSIKKKTIKRELEVECTVNIYYKTLLIYKISPSGYIWRAVGVVKFTLNTSPNNNVVTIHIEIQSNFNHVCSRVIIVLILKKFDFSFHRYHLV